MVMQITARIPSKVLLKIPMIYISPAIQHFHFRCNVSLKFSFPEIVFVLQLHTLGRPCLGAINNCNLNLNLGCSVSFDFRHSNA